jgi:hypothetical protein
MHGAMIRVMQCNLKTLNNNANKKLIPEIYYDNSSSS